MWQKISRQRISGISFKRGKGAAPHARLERVMGTGLELTVAEVRSGEPPQISQIEIRHLFADLGRQELHTLVEECVDQCSRWSQVSKACQKLFEEVRAQHWGDEQEKTPQYSLDDAALVVEAVRNFRLWRHRLAILEMIADGQMAAEWQKQAKLKRNKATR